MGADCPLRDGALPARSGKGSAVERVSEQGRNVEHDAVEWERMHEARRDYHEPEPLDDTAADLEAFPVMVRLSQVQSQIGYLTQTVERLSQTVERLERALADGLIGLRHGARSSEPFAPTGVTARANPMTHPVTTPTTRAAFDAGRDDALAGVRVLFQTPRRPWWERFSEHLRG